MTDPRIAIIEKRGIEGQDAITSLATIDRVLAHENMKSWLEISDIMNGFDTHQAAGQYGVSVFGHDAWRAAVALNLEGWRG